MLFLPQFSVFLPYFGPLDLPDPSLFAPISHFLELLLGQLLPLQLLQKLIEVVNLRRHDIRVACALELLLVGLQVVLAALEPAALIQALSIEEDEAQHRTVVGFVDLLRDMSQVEAEDLITSDLVTLFLC